MPWDTLLSLLASLIVIAAVLYGSYLLSRWLTSKANRFTGGSNIKIVERAALTQDKGLAIASVCGKYYLVSFSSNGVELLKELSEDELLPQPAPLQGSFAEALGNAVKSRWDVMKHERRSPFARNGAPEAPGDSGDFGSGDGKDAGNGGGGKAGGRDGARAGNAAPLEGEAEPKR